MKKNKLLLITWLLIIIMIISNIVSIYIAYDSKNNIPKIIRSVVIQEVSKNIKSIPIPKDGKDGYTPIKGIDYFDGYNGSDGKDGVNGTNGLNGYIPIKNIDYFDGKDGNNGLNGLTPIIRCNTVKNRWEIRYNIDETWKILNDQSIKCTIKE